MVDVLTEELIPLDKARRLPPFLRDGKPISFPSLYRYCVVGVRMRGGGRVRLGHVRGPRGLMTSRAAIERWFDAMTNGTTDADKPSASETNHQHEQAEDELEAAGI